MIGALKTCAASGLAIALFCGAAQSQTAALDAAKCRAGAQAIAKRIGGSVGEQTDAMVSIKYPRGDIGGTYFCGPLSAPGLSVSWTSGGPTTDTLNVAVEAGAAWRSGSCAGMRGRRQSRMSRRCAT
jgi:hypothetical protein